MPSIRERLSKAVSAFRGKEERAMPLALEGMFRDYGMGPSFKPEESLAAYGDNVWLYGAVNKIAQEIARTQFRLQKVNAKDEIEPIRSHQALETLAKPQPTKAGKSMLTSMDPKYVTGMHMLLNGEAFWYLDKRMKINGAPTFIDVLLPQYMFQRITNGEITEYVYRLPEKEIVLDPMSVVHFKLPDPQHYQRGHSPTQAIRYAVDVHKESDILAAKRLENNAVPAGIITTTTALNPEQQAKYREQWRQMYAGTSNANKVAVMPQGMDFKTVQQTNDEMQLVQGKQAIRLCFFHVSQRLKQLWKEQEEQRDIPF